MKNDDFIKFIEINLGLNLLDSQKKLISEYIKHPNSRVILLPASHGCSVMTKHITQLMLMKEGKNMDLPLPT